MATNGFHERSGRETRLLVLIVVVSLGVLLVLARFRFPASTLSVTPPVPSPLANLASRAAFRDLSDTIVTAYDNISPRIAVVRLEEVSAPVNGRGRSNGVSEPSALETRLATALRVRRDVGLVFVPDGFHVATVAGVDAEPIAADPARGIQLVRVPAVEIGPEASLEGFTGFSFVVQVTATDAGPSVQPVFIGRTGAREDNRWPSGVLGVDHPSLAAGSFLFTLEGRLIGLVIRDNTAAAVVPPSAIQDAVARLTAAAGTGTGS